MLGVDVELFVDVAHMGAGGALGDVELLLDVGGVAAFRQQEQDFCFLLRQTCYLKSRTKPKLLDRMLIIEYGIERHVDLLLRGIRI